MKIQKVCKSETLMIIKNTYDLQLDKKECLVVKAAINEFLGITDEGKHLITTEELDVLKKELLAYKIFFAKNEEEKNALMIEFASNEFQNHPLFKKD